jgi:hypothetical protein
VLPVASEVTVSVPVVGAPPAALVPSNTTSTAASAPSHASAPAGGSASPPGAPGDARANKTLAARLEELTAAHGPCPPLPSATADWSQRRPALEEFAGWLLRTCGLTQTEAADLLNQSGNRTQHGRDWRQWTVSALVNGRYDRRSAA